MINRYQAGTKLRDTVGKNAAVYIQNRDSIKRLILDSLQIADAAQDLREDLQGFYDWSIILAPLCKATEGLLMVVAEDIGIKIPDDNILGRNYSDDNLKKFIDDIKAKVEDSVDASYAEYIEEGLYNIRIFVKRYRNAPSHYDEENLSRITSVEQAISNQYAMLNRLQNLIDDLLKCELISLPKLPEPNLDDDPIDLSEIPF